MHGVEVIHLFCADIVYVLTRYVLYVDIFNTIFTPLKLNAIKAQVWKSNCSYCIAHETVNVITNPYSDHS